MSCFNNLPFSFVPWDQARSYGDNPAELWQRLLLPFAFFSPVPLQLVRLGLDPLWLYRLEAQLKQELLMTWCFRVFLVWFLCQNESVGSSQVLVSTKFLSLDIVASCTSLEKRLLGSDLVIFGNDWSLLVSVLVMRGICPRYSAIETTLYILELRNVVTLNE